MAIALRHCSHEAVFTLLNFEERNQLAIHSLSSDGAVDERWKLTRAERRVLLNGHDAHLLTLRTIRSGSEEAGPAHEFMLSVNWSGETARSSAGAGRLHGLEVLSPVYVIRLGMQLIDRSCQLPQRATPVEQEAEPMRSGAVGPKCDAMPDVENTRQERAGVLRTRRVRARLSQCTGDMER